MANLIHLQNALNKVVEDVRMTTLDDYTNYLIENNIQISGMNPDEKQTMITEYLKQHTTSTFVFGPKKREKKTRPPNSYNMFIKDKMREIKEANPEFKGKELMKRATQAWNAQKLAKQQEEANEKNKEVDSIAEEV